MAISLAKGQKISLDKEAGKALTKVVMGLGWDAKKTKGFLGFGGSTPDIDLDASCILFDDKNNVLDAVYFRQLRSKDGSITHTGDNRTGDGDGDDEQIIVNLATVPATVKTLMFTVNSFTDVTFDQIENAFCRVFDPSNNQEVAKYNLSCGGTHSAMIMAKLYRHQGEWKMHAIGENATGRTFQDLLPSMTVHL
jgi:tellurium resistance protein TerZ